MANIGSTVSRKLRTAGWNISPNARKFHHDGMFVSSRDDSVSVLVDLGQGGEHNHSIADQVAAELTVWPQTLGVRVSQSDSGSATVRFIYGR